MVCLSAQFFNFIDFEKGVLDELLVSGKGSRYTEQLHSKIQEMNDRIRNLEDALQAIHSEHASHPDQPPLMHPALLSFHSAQTAP